MFSCTFFGHRDTPQKAEAVLKDVLEDLINNKNVKNFYIGNNGNFDSMVLKLLKDIKVRYPFINYSVVLSRLPEAKNRNLPNTLFPCGLEKTPPKFSISKRNSWMIDKCEYVVVYVERPFGGAAKFKEIAKRKGKNIINIADLQQKTRCGD